MVWLGVGSFVFPDFRSYLRPWPISNKPHFTAGISFGGRSCDRSTYSHSDPNYLEYLRSGCTAICPTELNRFPHARPDWNLCRGRTRRTGGGGGGGSSKAGSAIAGIGGLALIGAAVFIATPIISIPIAIIGIGLLLGSLFSRGSSSKDKK